MRGHFSSHHRPGRVSKTYTVSLSVRKSFQATFEEHFPSKVKGYLCVCNVRACDPLCVCVCVLEGKNRLLESGLVGRQRYTLIEMEANKPGGSADAANSENKAAVNRNRNEKLIRLITVIAYFCSVSGAAVMLSLYYIFLWDPDPRSNHAAFQEPNSHSYTPHSQLPNSLSSTSASSLLRHLVGNHTTVTGMSFSWSSSPYTERKTF